MPALDDARVAVYIDFDNIVISRYDQVHRRGEWGRDGARNHAMTGGGVGGYTVPNAQNAVRHPGASLSRIRGPAS